MNELENDIEISSRIAEGDNQAFEKFVDKYDSFIKSMLKRRLSSYPELIEECTNDVYTAVWKNIKYYDSTRNSLKNWIAGVVRFKVADCLRIIYKEAENLKHNSENFGVEDMSYIDKELENIENSVKEELNVILSSLNDIEKAIVIKRYIEEYTIDELVSEMEMTKKELYNKLFYAKVKIKKHMEV